MNAWREWWWKRSLRCLVGLHDWGERNGWRICKREACAGNRWAK